MKSLKDIFRESLLDDEDEIEKTTKEEANWINLTKDIQSFRKNIRRFERILKRKGKLCQVSRDNYEIKGYKGYNHYIAVYHFQTNTHMYSTIVCNDGEVDSVTIYSGWKDTILGPIYRHIPFQEFIQQNEIDEIYIVPEELEWFYERMLKYAHEF